MFEPVFTDWCLQTGSLHLNRKLMHHQYKHFNKIKHTHTITQLFLCWLTHHCKTVLYRSVLSTLVFHTHTHTHTCTRTHTPTLGRVNCDAITFSKIVSCFFSQTLLCVCVTEMTVSRDEVRHTLTHTSSRDVWVVPLHSLDACELICGCLSFKNKNSRDSFVTKTPKSLQR